MKKSLLFIALFLTAGLLKAQTPTTDTTASSTDALMKNLSKSDKDEPVIATFKATRLILSQTTETVKKNELNFLVIHRFGDLAGSNGGGKTMWGLDNSTDIYIGFEYGLTDNLNIDFGRSKFESLLELGLKYNILHQKADNSVPVAVTLIGKTGFKTYHANTPIFDNYTNRFSYLAQAVIARKFSSALSLQVSPMYLINNAPYPFFVWQRKKVFLAICRGSFKIYQAHGHCA
jgi:hypothetical protein